MFDKLAKMPNVTWKTIQLNPFIFGIMGIPIDSNSTLSLIATSCVLVGSSLMPLGIARVPVSVSIACRIIFVLGCSIGGLGLANILESLFPNFPTVREWIWVQWVPSILSNLAVVIWVFVILKISPITRSLLISTVLVAAAAGYSLSCDARAIEDFLLFDVIREAARWEEGIAYFLQGSALVVWAHLIMRKLATSPLDRSIHRGTLLVGVGSILLGIFEILSHIFS